VIGTRTAFFAQRRAGWAVCLRAQAKIKAACAEFRACSELASRQSDYVGQVRQSVVLEMACSCPSSHATKRLDHVSVSHAYVAGSRAERHRLCVHDRRQAQEIGTYQLVLVGPQADSES
jgi:hypothetical protein